jgi:hypothetical protein
MLMNEKNHRHPEMLAAQRRASKDRPQTRRVTSGRGHPSRRAQERAPQDDGGDVMPPGMTKRKQHDASEEIC